MFDSASRFIIAYALGSGTIAGFSTFRFDMEDTMHDNRQVAVVYWCIGSPSSSAFANLSTSYEVQVDERHRGAGLGHLLMQALEVLGQTYKMRRVMLTVFTGELDVCIACRAVLIRCQRMRRPEHSTSALAIQMTRFAQANMSRKRGSQSQTMTF